MAGRVDRLNWRRIALLTLTGVLTLAAIGLAQAEYDGYASAGLLGGDFREYQQFARHYVQTGEAYRPSADGWALYPGVAGLPGPMRYPPPGLILLVAFQFIPWPLWWAIPIGVTAWVMWWWRPATWSFPIIALIACSPAFAGLLIQGNTDLWAVALVALATRWPAIAALLVIKPNQTLFALPFLMRRTFWLAVAIVCVVSLPLLPLWLDWTSVLGRYGGTPWIYSVWSWPNIALPLIARLATTRPVQGLQPASLLVRRIGAATRALTGIAPPA